MSANISSNSAVPYRSLAVVALGGGALLLALSACALLGFLVIPIVQTATALVTNTSLLSFAAVGVGYGSLLILIGRGLRQNRPATFQRLPSPLVFLALFLVALVIGQVTLSLDFAPAYFFPWWHVLASLGVPLAVLAFAVRRLPPIPIRTLLAQFSWGGLVTIALAVVFELVIGGILAAVAFVGIIIVLGSERTRALLDTLVSGFNPTRAIEIITQEPLAILIVALTAIVLFVVVVPLIEETLKAGGPAILMARRVRAKTLPTKGEVVLWGVAAGAGYAFTENLFNATNALSGGQGADSFWAAGMLIRSGTSLMHIVATTTVTIGWYQTLVNGKTARLFWLVLLAMAAHALWNTGAIIFGTVASLGSQNPALTVVSTLFVGMALLLLVVLCVVFLFWLARLVRWAQPPPVEIITAQNETRLNLAQVKEINSEPSVQGGTWSA